MKMANKAKAQGIEVKRYPYPEEQHVIMKVYPRDKIVYENTAAAIGADWVEVFWPEDKEGVVVERTISNRFYLRLATEVLEVVIAIAKATGKEPNKVVEELIKRGLHPIEQSKP